MHSSNLDTDGSSAIVKKDGGEALVMIATLVTEGRIPGKLGSKTKKFYEGPHCTPQKPQPDIEQHHCDLTDPLCKKYNTNKDIIKDFWRKNQPLCIEVVLHCACKEKKDFDSEILLEQWYFCTNSNRSPGPLFFNVQQLTSAIRSQLYFSQIAAWLTSQDENTPCKIDRRNLSYRLVQPPTNHPDTATKFSLPAVKHDFPLTDIANGQPFNVTFLSLPRMSSMPNFACDQCLLFDRIVDDRMLVSCTLKGKHRCEDLEEFEDVAIDQTNYKRLCPASTSTPFAEKKNDLKDKGQMLLDAIERSAAEERSESDSDLCDMNESDIISIKKTNNNFNVYVDKHCDSPIPKLRQNKKILPPIYKAKQKIQFNDNDDKKDSNVVDIPTAFEQAKFRKNFDNAASMVFHSRTGLPLTSSPAPVRRGKNCFDFDSSINSVYAIRSALFSGSLSTDDESESEGSIVSPCSPEIFTSGKKSEIETSPVKYRRKGHAANLLGSFEESVLNGRLEPVSTVHGFRAELGASGSFVPKHLVVPVTVFFYTLGDYDKVSSPYLSHINLGKKGYNVPKCGTVQVTLFNPLGTVVKMFVIMYDLSDMPPNSQTFIRQRTLYMPTHCKDDNLEWGPKWLRYLIHLRFMSSKSGKIYLHSDIRMIIFRKSDMDTATAHGLDMSYELRSFTHMPANPRFSPRK